MDTETTTMLDRAPSLGRIIGRAFTVMRNNPLVIFGIAVLLSALPQVAIAYLVAVMGPDMMQPGAFSAGRMIGLSFGGFVLAVMIQVVVQGVIVHATLVDRNGGRAKLGESVAFAFGRALPLLAVSLLFTVAMGLGLLLLVIPFFIVTTRWAVASAVVVAERSGIGEAFARSAELTAGARWKILGLGILLVIGIWAIAAIGGVIRFATTGIAATPAMALNLPSLLINMIVNTITTTIWSTVQASLYVELADWKDGPAAQTLADIFR